MTERTRTGKNLGQDASGFLFCLVGGFFAVSLALFLRGQEPKPGVVTLVTGPVVQLGEWLGAWAALALSLAVAALGTALFLRAKPLPTGRWLGALAVAALGLAFVLGAALDRGGDLGALFPALVSGLGGRALGVVLGAALLWIGASLAPLGPLNRRAAAGSATDALQRLSLRHDGGAAGVSPAEAALLVSEPRSPKREARETARREEPARAETIRPYTPPKDARKKAEPAETAPREPGNSRSRSEPRAAASALAPGVRPLGAPRSDTSASAPGPRPGGAAFEAPPAPAWERAEEDEPAPSDDAPGIAELDSEADAPPVADVEPMEAQAPAAEPVEPASEPVTVAADDGAAPPPQVEEPGAVERPGDPFAVARRALEAELALDDLAVHDLDEAPDEAELEVAELAPPTPPAPAWEQVDLFGEEEPAGEPQPARPARGELTPTFDFGDEAPRTVHEPEPADDPFAAASAAADDPPARTEAPEPDTEPEAVLQPAPPKPRAKRKRKAAEPQPAAEPEPAEVEDDEPATAEARVEPDSPDAAWHRLVFDSGCAILDENRVAVSMLERRFAIDFDQACRVLDELQAAGLIGPYMGGRTRDILLTREQWLSQAPQGS